MVALDAAQQPAGARAPRRRARAALATGLATLCWLGSYTVLVTYDLRAWTVVRSAWHYLRFPVDPSIIADLPSPPPEQPAAVDAYVERLLPWAADASIYGLPWYFPTPREALEARHGDCEAQAVVLASILAARGVPFTFRASFSHLWVDYPGRRLRAGERPAEAMMENVGGRYRFHWPALPRLKHHLEEQKELLWDPLAPTRKALLLVGWQAILIAVPRRRRKPKPK